MHFPQAMRQPRHATPLLPLVVLLLIYCASGCVAAAPATQYRCGFDEMMMRSGPLSTAVVREVPRKGQGAMQAYTVATQDDDSGWEPIRIAVFTEDLEGGTDRRKRKKYCEEGEDECYNALGHKVSCTPEHVLTEEKKQLYTGKILPGAVKLHAERLLVKPASGNLNVPTMGSPCNQFTISTEHRRNGVLNVDFIIYAAAMPSGTKSMAVWAVTCSTWGDFRPSIGAMNFDPKYMTDTAWSVRVAAHELAHALGFSKERMEEKSMLKSANIVRGTHRRMVAGKHVQEKAKAHFGCDSLEGMELEDEDGVSSRKIPHWKERHARDELMAPTVGAGYYTALTMAVFADMEYYSVNWSMAEPMSWGNSTGCDFLEKKCNETTNLAGNYPRMFCDDSDKETLRCTSDRRHVGKCTATIVEDKGSLVDRDVCPVVSLEFHEISSGTTYNACSDGTVTSLPGSLTGDGSWCLDAELLEKKDDNGHKSVKGVCAQVLCEEGTVKVKYSESKDFQPCPEDTDIPVTLNGFEQDGKIKCPIYGEVCTIAANGSSIVIPRALEDDTREERGEEGEAAVAAPALSPGAEALTKASPADLPAEEYSSEDGPSEEASTAEASPPGKNSEAPVVQAALKQPQQESEAEQMTAVGEPATTQQVPPDSSQENAERAATLNSHAVGGATGDAGTVRERRVLPLLLLLLGLWGFASQ
ncbi:putative surface protease GP63 [Trypanosoma cruzi]|uniref:Leishmanolysin-like peptidase n=2 Tax=Trypanosoma cruzi TaxID=5693 RepID=Q4DMQ1_TRYCC|nr:surface protease GP63, putative [Trypanosoma cruzi]EAN93807.1 surface protease GP63, putative [Trypanosoma cruzi]PWV21004.1 putative surface protease GP63 [Trypanosoma cruzi]PWV21005.1 putative surface protease GP63 [Trypanosoma cruzi]RNC41601.1 putative surface protease GP63 [Trypanosoma cruzi]|eukprot:XP_815658.1 surface protease GP63 [Trypanosoma cruzi strain CL Brener]